jgi:hypothetical protein
MEQPAKNTRGYILYNPFKEKQYFFRKYNEDGTFTDYDLNIEELAVEILSENASFYEKEGRKILDWSSRTLNGGNSK